MGHTVIALHTVIRYTRIFGWNWGKIGIWKSSDRIWACSRQFFFLEKWKSRILKTNFGILETLREHWGVLGAVVFSGKWQSGILEALREHWGMLKAVFFLGKWQSGILEGLHTLIVYPHGH